ncbi:MAG TPA: ribosomal protein S18-alanine N-acetyltransferase [Terriglobales bacterium]
MIAIRAGTAADLPELMGIARDSATAAQWKLEQYESLTSLDSDREFLVVVENSQVCGFIVGREVALEWEIENIAVSGNARRRGLGSRLLGEFLDRMRAGSSTSVFLEVRESNLAARKLYEKWGFVETGRRKSYYHDPSEDALLLRLSFPQPS